MKYFCNNLAFRLFLLGLFLTGLPAIAISQNNSAKNDTTDKVVRAIRFVGNENVNDNTLETLIRTKTNREFLGIPRFTPWYFVYKLTGKFGEKPAFLDRATISNDIKRISQYYKTVGYLNASIDTSVVEFKPDKMEVSFLIEEGQPFSIQTLSYSGMPQFSDSTKVNEFLDNSLLTENKINDSTFAVKKQYSEDKLSAERNRLITFLKNNGYASAQKDSIRVLMKKRSSNKYQLDGMFRINPGKKYTFGDLYISLAGPDDSVTYDQQKAITSSKFTARNSKMQLQKESAAQTRFSLLTDQILFKPGDTFNNSLYVQTVNEFQNLGMLNVRQFSLSEDGSLPDYSKEEIPVSFKLKTLPKHSINFNVFGMKRYGFGSGAGLTYTNNNLFGEAENLQLSLNGSFEYVTSKTRQDIAPDSSGNSVGGDFFQNFESRAEYSLPRLTFPFGWLDDKGSFLNGRTRFSVSFSRSDQLLFDINSDVRFKLRYEVDHNERFTSFLDLLELDLLDTDPTRQFQESLAQDFGENSLEYQRILEDFRPQVSSILRYTFRSERTDLIKRNYGYFSEYSIAVGGNIPYLTDRYIITPNTIEGNLPPIFPNSQNSLSYSRFLKGTADYRRYTPISNHGVFAYRGFFGMAYPYGESRTIPLNRRFYAGGSNDIRGWEVYSLGPGGISLDNLTINGGEIKLLAQTEVRQRFIHDFISADWIAAWFTDAGNIWYGPRTDFSYGNSLTSSSGPSQSQQQRLLEAGRFKFDEFYKQIAVGSGLGIRLDWQYVVARFDFAFRIHDLQQGWLKDRKMYFSFGIGHSF